MQKRPPIVLHHGDNTRSVRVRWVLEELAIPYELHPVRFPPRHRQPEYLQENPLGSLPLMVDGEVRLTESMAICEYLLKRHGPTPLEVAPDEAGFAAYRQFCWYGEATLMPPIGLLLVYGLFTPEDQRPKAVLAAAREMLAQRLEPISRALSNAEHLAAGRFTLADVSVAYALGLAAFLKADDGFTPEIAAYRARLAERPAYRRAYQPAPAG